jgi:hypothetical protein
MRARASADMVEGTMFETFAVLTTISLVVVFAVLVYLDRKGREEESAGADSDS